MTVRTESCSSERGGTVIINNHFTGATLTFHGGNMCLGVGSSKLVTSDSVSQSDLKAVVDR